MSRPALYSRISRLEALLGFTREADAEQRTAIYLALMAYRLNPDDMFARLKKYV